MKILQILTLATSNIYAREQMEVPAAAVMTELLTNNERHNKRAL